MKTDTSRRNFLAAGLALPAAGLASTTSGPAPAPQQGAPSRGKITYRVLGKTGMKVSSRRLRRHDHVRPDRDHPGRRHGHQLLRYFPRILQRPKRADGGSRVGSEAEGRLRFVQVRGQRQGRRPGASRNQPQGAQHRPPGRLAAASHDTPRPRSPTIWSTRCARPSSRARRGSSA